MRAPVVTCALSAIVLAIVACGSFDGTPEVNGGGDGGADASTDVGSDATLEGDVGDGGVSANGVLATTAGTPSRVGTDGTYVYWLEAQARIMRALPASGATEVVATGPISAMAVNQSFVVWGVPQYRSVPTGSINDTPSTSAAKVLPSVVLNQLAFWSEPSHISDCDLPCVSTGIAVQIDAPAHLVSGGSRIFFFGRDPDGGVDTNLWWKTATAAGSAPEGLLATQTQAVQAAASDQRVYWVETTGALRGVDHVGGNVEQLATVEGVTAMTADNAGLYVADVTGIRRFNPQGSGQSGMLLASVAPGQPVSSMVIMGNRLLWSVPNERAIRHAPK